MLLFEALDCGTGVVVGVDVKLCVGLAVGVTDGAVLPDGDGVRVALALAVLLVDGDAVLVALLDGDGSAVDVCV